MPPPVKDVKPTTKFREPRALPESLWGDVCKLRKIAMAEKLNPGSKPRTKLQRTLATPGNSLEVLRSPARLPPTAKAPIAKDFESFQVVPSRAMVSPGSNSNISKRSSTVGADWRQRRAKASAWWTVAAEVTFSTVSDERACPAPVPDSIDSRR